MSVVAIIQNLDKDAEIDVRPGWSEYPVCVQLGDDNVYMTLLQLAELKYKVVFFDVTEVKGDE